MAESERCAMPCLASMTRLDGALEPFPAAVTAGMAQASKLSEFHLSAKASAGSLTGQAAQASGSCQDRGSSGAPCCAAAKGPRAMDMALLLGNGCWPGWEGPCRGSTGGGESCSSAEGRQLGGM